MSAQTPNPSLALVLKNAEGLSANAAIRGKGQRPNNLEAPLMKTVYYAYYEPNFSRIYSFEVVNYGMKGVKIDGEHSPSGSKFSKLLNCLMGTWNRRWRPKGNDKAKSSPYARRSRGHLHI